MSGVYESEDMLMTDLNPSSVLNFTTNGEGKIEVAIKTATSTAALAASYTAYATTTSGSKILPVSGAQYAKVRVTLSRPIPTNRQPYVGAKETGTWIGNQEAKYQRSFANPILYSFNISNQKGYHVTNTDFGTNSASTTLTSNATSGPIVSSLLTGDGGLTLPYTFGVPGQSVITDEKGTITTGTSTLNAITYEAQALQRPDGKTLIITGYNSNTTQIYDPYLDTFTAGPTLTTTAGDGLYAFQRPDGKFFITLGGVTTTNIYDPIANTMTVGPALTASTVCGTHAIQRPDGKFLILGTGSTGTNLYDPIANTITVGPTITGTIYCGSHSIPRPDGKHVIIHAGNNSSTSLYDPVANTIIAAQGTNANGYMGAHSIQRPDGKWLLIYGNGANSTSLFDPSASAGFVSSVGVNNFVGWGAHSLQRPDGKFLVVNGNSSTNSSIYNPFNDTMSTGPAFPATINYGSLSIQRPDGKFLILRGGSTTDTYIYDPGWVTRGYYESEFINDTTLDNNSVLVWKGNADAYKSGVVSVRVRTATSTNALQTAAWRTLPVSGSRISPSHQHLRCLHFF
jgi:hypothetical protein